MKSTSNTKGKTMAGDKIVEISVVYLHEYRVVTTDQDGHRTVLYAAKVAGLTPIARDEAGVSANKHAQSAWELLTALDHPIEKTNFLEGATPAGSRPDTVPEAISGSGSSGSAAGDD